MAVFPNIVRPSSPIAVMARCEARAQQIFEKARKLTFKYAPNLLSPEDRKRADAEYRASNLRKQKDEICTKYGKEIYGLLMERNSMRDRGHYGIADDIRKAILQCGFGIVDQKNGSVILRKARTQCRKQK